MSIKRIVEYLYPLHRTLASDGMREALDLIKEFLEGGTLHEYRSGTNAWSWIIPQSWDIDEAWLAVNGVVVLDFDENPLNLVSYSIEVDDYFTWDEIKDHLYVSKDRPAATPWVFKYYDDTWGFCMPKQLLDAFPEDGTYHVVIKPRYGDSLEVLDHVIPGSKSEMLLMAHVCHPNQANDDAAGVATLIEVARRLKKTPLPPGSMTVRFLFGPETIGPIAYLANNDDVIDRTKSALFAEMTGTDGTLKLQKSMTGQSLIDQVANVVMGQAGQLERYDFGDLISNDERVTNAPGLDIPTVSLSRFPYPEYHTSDDNLDIIHEEQLQQAADIIEEIVRVYASNFIPVLNFKGPIMLSRYDLFLDWRKTWIDNRRREKIMLSMNGKRSVFDIAQQFDLDYWSVYDEVMEFEKKGLLMRKEIDDERRKPIW